MHPELRGGVGPWGGALAFADFGAPNAAFWRHTRLNDERS